MSATDLPPPPSLHEAEAFSALQRAVGHALALGATLDEATNALCRAGLDRHERHLAKVRELERYLGAQIATLAKRLGGGE